MRGYQMPDQVASCTRAGTRGYNDDLAIAPDGKTLLFTRMSLDRPNEILR